MPASFRHSRAATCRFGLSSRQGSPSLPDPGALPSERRRRNEGTCPGDRPGGQNQLSSDHSSSDGASCSCPLGVRFRGAREQRGLSCGGREVEDHGPGRRKMEGRW